MRKHKLKPDIKHTEGNSCMAGADLSISIY